MEIYLIYGEENVGKTTTCRKILDWLDAHNWKQITYGSIENPAEGWIGDFKAKGVINDKTVAVYSPGDDCGHIREAISFGLQLPCSDILIATVRKGIHYHKPLEHFKNSPEHTINWLTLHRCANAAEQHSQEEELTKQITDKIIL